MFLAKEICVIFSSLARSVEKLKNCSCSSSVVALNVLIFTVGVRVPGAAVWHCWSLERNEDKPTMPDRMQNKYRCKPIQGST